ncbi:MAG: proton-conducting membrane transporter, partial [Planctomycetes bacterium]|nr:proton-conducting membrane transporter [Planctomycetota bacterium]
MADTNNTALKIDISQIDTIVANIGSGPETVIPTLQAIQDKYKYLPRAALRRVCEITEISPAAIAGVSTFYSQFRHRPVGEHIVHVCNGTACHVKGAELVQDAIRRYLKIKDDRDTDADGLFTVQSIACLGCCTLAPVVQIEDTTYGHVQSDSVPQILRDFLERKAGNGHRRPDFLNAEAPEPLGEIRLGLGSCCIAGGSGKVKRALEKSLAETGARARIKRVGCVGMCHQTPLVEVVMPNQTPALYARVKPGDVREIVLHHFKPEGILKRINSQAAHFLDYFEQLLGGRPPKPIDRYSIDVRDVPVAAFLDRQRHIATEYYGIIDPVDIEEYRNRDGFKALRRCLLKQSPEQIIEQISRSGLRGRGGAGFSTGQKWSYVRNSDKKQKYIICNGDEGDPGA